MQEVADFLVGHQHTGRAAAFLAVGIDFIERVKPLAGPPERDMKAKKGMREPRHVGRDRLQILPIWHQTAKDRIGERLPQVAQHLFGIVLGKRADIDRERLRQSEHHLRRQGALVVLDLVEIACRDPEALGELTLVEAAGITQMTDLRTGENFLTHKQLVTLQMKIANYLPDHAIDADHGRLCRYLSKDRSGGTLYAISEL